MTALFISRPWNRQPQYPGPIRRDTAVGAGLVSLILPQTRRDLLLDSRALTYVGTSVVAADGQMAFSVTGGGGDSIQYSGGFGAIVPVAKPFTLIMRVFKPAIGEREILTADFNSAATTLSFLIEATAANAWLTYNSGVVAASGGTVTAGWHNIVATCSALQAHQVWVDGVLVINRAAGIGRTAGTTAAFLGAGAFVGTNGWNGKGSLLGISDVAADENFALEFNRNPWGTIFKPLQSKIFMGAAAAGGTIIGPLIGRNHLGGSGPLISGRLVQ